MGEVVSLTNDLHQCKQCKKSKHISEYPKDNKTQCGYRLTICKLCNNEKNRFRKNKKKFELEQTDAKYPKHFLFNPTRPDVSLKNKYDILNPETYLKWKELNSDNYLALEQTDILRKSMLGGRDSWHEREFHSAQSLGFFHNPLKDGADAHKANGQPVEIKVNWVSSEENQNALDGSGSFNDYSIERYDRLFNDGYSLLIPCYIDYKLVLAVEVPLSFNPLKEQLYSCFETTSNKRVVLTFSFTHWIDCPDLIWHVVPNLHDLIQYKNRFSVSFFNKIVENMNKMVKDNKGYKLSSDII